MQESENVEKYQVNNNKTVQGQIVGDHHIIHQHFYPIQDAAAPTPRPQDEEKEVVRLVKQDRVQNIIEGTRKAPNELAGRLPPSDIQKDLDGVSLKNDHTALCEADRPTRGGRNPSPSSKSLQDISALKARNMVSRISIPKSKKSLLISATILLALAFSLLPFFPLPTCSFPFCYSSQRSIKQSSSQDEREVQNQNLSVELIDVVSPSFVFLDDPKRHSGGTPPSTDISAVLLPKNASTYDTIIVNVQNLRYGGAYILIDSIALHLLSIPPFPQRPLSVWTPGGARTYIAYPYPVTYTGQTPGQLLYAEPLHNVTLEPRETNQLSIQVLSRVTAFLQFQVQIFYRIANANTESSLILPRTFQVVFSDASNWHEKIL